MRRLGKYELESEIGHGGMATVYRARDTVLERAVAVKVLHPHLRKSPEARERFTREARSVARLRHPFIMEIYDFAGEDAEESYLVAELLTGPTLRELADAHDLPAEAAVALALPVAEALAAAHEAGIVHRDVKPENVLLHEGRTVKLTDFGIAQMVDAQSFTHTGQILGSPGHMAPEQIETGEVDARSDVFALGTVLFLLATGMLPFQGKNAHQVLKQVVDCEFPDPLRLRPTIGKELAQILQRALAKAPEDRYATAGELAAALRSFLADHDVDDPQELLASFLADPEGEGEALAQRVLARLEARAEAAVRNGDRGLALVLYDRILAFDEQDEAALAAVQRLAQRPTRWPRAAGRGGGAARRERRGRDGARSWRACPGARTPFRRRRAPATRATAPPPPPAPAVPAPAPVARPVVAEPEKRRPVVRRPALLRPGQRRVVRLRPQPQNVRISVDGGEARPFGPDFTQVELEPGQHVFRVSGSCCQTLERAVTVGREAEPMELSLPLIYTDARLLVRVPNAPADARVAVKTGSGRVLVDQGLVNQILRVPVGRERAPRATVTVTAAGHRAYTRAVRLTSGGDTYRLVAELEPAPVADGAI